MTLNEPIALEEPTEITAVIFATDPELPAGDGPNGRFSFAQTVGITGDELEAVQSWNSERFKELLAVDDHLLVTDLGRGSLLGDTERTLEWICNTWILASGGGLSGVAMTRRPSRPPPGRGKRIRKGTIARRV